MLRMAKPLWASGSAPAGTHVLGCSGLHARGAAAGADGVSIHPGVCAAQSQPWCDQELRCQGGRAAPQQGVTQQLSQ